MTTLNAEAAEIVRGARPHAVTDVTGFGLVGHAREVAEGAGLRAEIDFSAVELLPGVRELIADGHIPGGTRTNLELAAAYARYGLTYDDFTSSRFVRLRRIRELLAEGAVDEMLRRTAGPAEAAGGGAPQAG